MRRAPSASRCCWPCSSGTARRSICPRLRPARRPRPPRSRPTDRRCHDWLTSAGRASHALATGGRAWNMLALEVFNATVARDRSRRRVVPYMKRSERHHDARLRGQGGLRMTLDVKAQALDLAVIGNCRTAALVDTGGRIVWWCFPRFDSDPVFSRLLSGNEEKGFCDVAMEGQTTTEAAYQRNTAI